MGDFIMGLIVDDVSLNDNHQIIIIAKTAAETTEPFPIRANTSYTFICSGLASDEEVPIEVYDPSLENFVQLYDEGYPVKFAQNHSKITFTNESMMIQFVKPITDDAIGLSVFYA